MCLHVSFLSHDITSSNLLTNSNERGSKMADTTSPKKSGLGITALVLGIVAIVGSWVPILNNFSAFLAVLGAIFGIIGLVVIAKSNGAKGGKGIAIAGTVISVLAFVIVLAAQSMYGTAIDKASESVQDTTSKASGDATEELLKTDVDVTFAEYKVDSKTYGSYTSNTGALTVTVTNKAADAKSYNIQVEAVDASGNRIQDGYVAVNSLGAGQSKSQEIFNSVSDDEINKYKACTFKVVKVSQY